MRDNAKIERLFRNCKWERLYPEIPQTVSELKQMTKRYWSALKKVPNKLSLCEVIRVLSTSAVESAVQTADSRSF